MKTRKTATILLSILLGICIVCIGFTAFWYIYTIYLANIGTLDVLAIIATAPAFLIGSCVTIPLSIIDLICVRLCLKKDKISHHFGTINTILDIAFICLPIVLWLSFGLFNS